MSECASTMYGKFVFGENIFSYNADLNVNEFVNLNYHILLLVLIINILKSVRFSRIKIKKSCITMYALYKIKRNEIIIFCSIYV